MYILNSGFSSFFKKIRRVRTHNHWKHNFKEIGDCFLIKSPSVGCWLCFCAFISVERWAHIQKDVAQKIML